MANLTAARLIEILPDANSQQRFTMASNARLYQGAAVGLSAGLATSLASGLKFAGFAWQNGANNLTGVETPQTFVEVITEGIIRGVTITGASGDANYDADVFLSTDNVGDLTLTATSAVKIGKICGYDSGRSTFSVRFTASAYRSPTVS